MFILTTFSDLVSIPPNEFHKPDLTNINSILSAKYANRIVQKIGLCISLHSLLSVSDGLIGHDTGTININVTFTMIVFRPFKGEILTGVIKKCSPEGLEVTLQFFDNVYVPKRMLFEGTVFDEGEKAWVWRNEEAELWFDEGTVVNVRVEAERWRDLKRRGPDGEGDEGEGVAYAIDASIMESGLGGLDWW